MAKNDSWWVKISVSLTDHFVWNGEPFTRGQAWVDLILLVNHEPTKAVVDGQVIEVGIGEYVTSIRRLADRWGRSTKWVMDYLELLRSDNMIKTKVVGHGKNSKTLLFLVNYEGFQLSGNVKETNRKRIENAKKTQDGGKGVSNNNIYNTYPENEDLKNKGNITPNTLTSITPKGVDTHSEYEAEFEEIWKHYPKKHGKPNALRDYIKARKNGVERKTIEDGLTAYIEYCKRTNRFFKDGSTWFHQQAWDDDYEDDLTQTEKSGFDIEEHVKRMREEGLL